LRTKPRKKAGNTTKKFCARQLDAYTQKGELMDMENDEKFRSKMCDELWRSQVLPKFREAAMSDVQTDAARKMFNAGFESGWESHKAHLTKQFIVENQKQKVHLA